MWNRILAAAVVGLLNPLNCACSTEDRDVVSPDPAVVAPGDVAAGHQGDRTPSSPILRKPDVESKKPETARGTPADPAVEPDEKTKTAIATFGAGCYWCVEAVLEQLDGVQDVTSGFMGGAVANPTYEQVCAGTSGHAEVVRVKFDPAKISYKTLLKWFFKLHDPTTLNRQGADVGTQYRSVIFYHGDEQKGWAEEAKQRIDDAGVFADPIVTEISSAGEYYEADGEHQDFYRLNKQNGYCRVVITPKLDKLGLDK